MTEAFEKAVIAGIGAFAREFLKANGVKVETTIGVTEVKQVVEAAKEPAEADTPSPAEKAPETPPAEKSPPTEAPPKHADMKSHSALTAEQIDAMDRPALVDYIVSTAIDQTPAFLHPQTGLGSLKGKRITTIQEWLKGYFGAGETRSQQAPPERKSPATEPVPVVEPTEKPGTTQLSLPVDDVPAVSADCSADPELRRKATTLMEGFAEWAGGQHAEQLKRFFANRGCEGNCLMHDRANIEGCWTRLNRKTT